MKGVDVLSICLLCFAMGTLNEAMNLTFTDCGSEGAEVESIDVQPCGTDPCILHHGTTYTSKITFIANENTKTATSKLDLTFLGMKVPFPLPPDACKQGIQCPVTSGSRQTGVVKMVCSPVYPKVNVIGMFRILDDEGKDMVCVKLRLTIRD